MPAVVFRFYKCKLFLFTRLSAERLKQSHCSATINLLKDQRGSGSGSRLTCVITCALSSLQWVLLQVLSIFGLGFGVSGVDIIEHVVTRSVNFFTCHLIQHRIAGAYVQVYSGLSSQSQLNEVDVCIVVCTGLACTVGFCGSNS